MIADRVVSKGLTNANLRASVFMWFVLVMQR
jgi:hypothetical protein